MVKSKKGSKAVIDGKVTVVTLANNNNVIFAIFDSTSGEEYTIKVSQKDIMKIHDAILDAYMNT